MSQYQYWAFISYNSKDQAWARWIQNALETYRIPRPLVGQQMPTKESAPKRFYPIFRDRDELPVSSDLVIDIENALTASRYLIVICSPNSAVSGWVNREIEIFRALGRDNRIFAVIVDGEPNSGKESECFPEALRQVQPLAADIRPHADGKRDTKLKLLSAMLGIGLDGLKQRDAQRQILRLEIILAVVTILSILIIGLGWYAYDQRTKAFVAQVESAKASVEPIDLLDFMLIDLHNSLEASDQIALASDVEEQAIQFLRNQDEWQGSGVSGLLLDAIYKTHMHQGDDFFTQQQFNESLKEYHASLKFLEWAEKTNFLDNSAEEKSKIYEKISNVLIKQGNLQEALSEYCKTLDIDKSLSAKDSTNKDLSNRLEMSYQHIGDLLVIMGNVDEALAQYYKAFDIAHKSVEPYQKDNGWSQRDVFVAHLRIGDALVLQKRYALAFAEYNAALNITQNLIDQEQAAISPIARLFGQYYLNKAWNEDLTTVQQRIVYVEQIEKTMHPFLGIRAVTLTPEFIHESNTNPNLLSTLPEIQGILLVQVFPDSLAAKADLRYGDVVIAINDKPLTSIEQLQNVLENNRNKSLKFTIQRSRETLELSIDTVN